MYVKFRLICGKLVWLENIVSTLHAGMLFIQQFSTDKWVEKKSVKKVKKEKEKEELASSDINRILLVPGTDDSLWASYVKEGSLQTSHREPCWVVEGNEAHPAAIVLETAGLPRDHPSPSWDLSLALSYLIHILFWLFLLLVEYCSNWTVVYK